MWNRVTLDNQHRTMKNKCCTISHKARNRRPRKQMWFTSRHIKCWYFPPRKDRCKTAVLPTLDVQPLNKTHHTHSTLLANHRRDGFVKSHVRSDNKFPKFVLRTKPTTISEVRTQMRWRKNPPTLRRPHKKTQRANGTTDDQQLRCGPRSRNLA